ncbi:MAG: hypothetical protein JWM93_2586, partial [Frankiales bacterium]|nr:hypothetical protein [Frankiales bacterium]
MTATVEAVARVAQLQTMIATLQGAGAPPAAATTFATQLATATAVPAAGG